MRFRAQQRKREIFVCLSMCVYLRMHTSFSVYICIYIHSDISKNRRGVCPKPSVGTPHMYGTRGETLRVLLGADKSTQPGELNPAWKIGVMKEPWPVEFY